MPEPAGPRCLRGLAAATGAGLLTATLLAAAPGPVFAGAASVHGAQGTWSRQQVTNARRNSLLSVPRDEQGHLSGVGSEDQQDRNAQAEHPM